MLRPYCTPLCSACSLLISSPLVSSPFLISSSHFLTSLHLSVFSSKPPSLYSPLYLYLSLLSLSLSWVRWRMGVFLWVSLLPAVQSWVINGSSAVLWHICDRKKIDWTHTHTHTHTHHSHTHSPTHTHLHTHAHANTLTKNTTHTHAHTDICAHTHEPQLNFVYITVKGHWKTFKKGTHVSHK